MKLGLVLEGGASRAYFTAGVLDYFLEQNIETDYLIGVSAGIANGISYVSKQHGRNIEIGEKYVPDKRYMGIKHMFNPKNRSYYNIDFVFSKLPEKYVPFDYVSFKNSKCETVAVVTNISTGKAEYIEIDEYEKTKKAVIASCSLPILFQPVKIDGKLYLDGGLADPVPVDKAIEFGCDKIIVITTREKGYKKTKESGLGLSSFLYRKYPKFVSLLKSRVTLYNKSHEYLCELEKNRKIFLISPDNTTNWGRTDSDPQKIRNIYNSGYETAKRLNGELAEYLKN